METLPKASVASIRTVCVPSFRLPSRAGERHCAARRRRTSTGRWPPRTPRTRSAASRSAGRRRRASPRRRRSSPRGRPRSRSSCDRGAAVADVVDGHDAERVAPRAPGRTGPATRRTLDRALPSRGALERRGGLALAPGRGVLVERRRGLRPSSSPAPARRSPRREPCCRRSPCDGRCPRGSRARPWRGPPACARRRQPSYVTVTVPSAACSEPAGRPGPPVTSAAAERRPRPGGSRTSRRPRPR